MVMAFLDDECFQSWGGYEKTLSDDFGNFWEENPEKHDEAVRYLYFRAADKRDLAASTGALSGLHRAADVFGDPTAQFRLGDLYSFMGGKGDRKCNPAMSLKYLKAAAHQAYEPAKLYLAHHQSFGEEDVGDTEERRSSSLFALFRRGGDMNTKTVACNCLGIRYMKGLYGCPKDAPMAVKWFLRAGTVLSGHYLWQMMLARVDGDRPSAYDFASAQRLWKGARFLKPDANLDAVMSCAATKPQEAARRLRQIRAMYQMPIPVED